MFAYCLNNPVNMADYTGNWPEWVTKAGGILLGAAAGALVVVAVVALAPAAVCATTTSLIAYGFSAAAAETVAEIGVAVVAADVTVYAMDTGYSAVTGESPVLEAMGYDYEAYELWQLASSAGIYGLGYMAGAGAQLGVCFVEGTLISTDEGQLPIEEIRPGDLVWAWNEETGEVALKPVIETYINECNELIHLSVNGEVITCTPNHPFYVPQKGWTEAVHLRAGDILVLLNGEYVVLEKVQHELLEAPVTVYNFQVEDYHTYYVGESSVRVHNASCLGADTGSILSGKKLTNQTGKVQNYVSPLQGNSAAMSDFYSMNPINVRTYSNGTIVGELSNGCIINIHPSTSLNGVPTVEIYNPSSGQSIKIRY